MKSLIIAAMVAIFSLSGCYTMTYSAQDIDGSPVSMSGPADSIGATYKHHLHDEEHQFWILYGAIPLTNLNIGNIVRSNIDPDKEQIANLTLTSSAQPFDILITVVGVVAISALANALAQGNVTNAGLLDLVGVFLVPETRTITIDGDVMSRPAKARS